MLKENIVAIKADLEKYVGVDRSQLYTDFLSYKLKATLEKYNETIEFSSSVLAKAASIRVMKALTKIQKKEDVANLKAAIEEQLQTSEEENE